MMNDVRKYTSSGRKRKQDELLDSYYAIYKVKCKCGHSLFMPYGIDKKLCTYCGNYVYKFKEQEFKEKLLRKIKEKEEYV